MKSHRPLQKHMLRTQSSGFKFASLSASNLTVHWVWTVCAKGSERVLWWAVSRVICGSLSCHSAALKSTEAQRVRGPERGGPPRYPAPLQHPQELEGSPPRPIVMLPSNSMTVCSQLDCFVKRWMPFLQNSSLPSGEGFHGYKRWHPHHNTDVSPLFPLPFSFWLNVGCTEIFFVHQVSRAQSLG